MKARRIIITGLIILTGFVLQAGIFTQFAWFNVTPNILLMITCTFGFMRGKKEGIVVGIICGLLTDVFSGGILGIYTLFFAYLGWLNGFLYKIFFMDYILFPMFAVIVGDLMYGVYVYVVHFLINGRLNFIYYLNNVILPEVVYTFAVSILLCHIILFINLKLEESEKRSAAKFV